MRGDRCGRKSALVVFFSLSVLAFVLNLLALLSPTWQIVLLEEGRTEHHHGLWLDCKRDYSNQYGKPKEYYETLWRRDMRNTPFDLFYYTPLDCVYKFDYWIDWEDLYDHNHDENRLQNDAYQHLFLGHKIAALVACGLSALFGFLALLLSIFAFCHRTFVSAATVLSTIAAFLSAVCAVVFHVWADYQDNKLLKEEEGGVYEQALGWAFYSLLVSMGLYWLSSLFGCFAASLAFQKGQSKLVKIEVIESADSSVLLDHDALATNVGAVSSSSRSTSAPFKRSFSAVFRVDSEALRQWERSDAAQRESVLRASQRQLGLRSNLRSEEDEAMMSRNRQSFQRTASMPNMGRVDVHQAARNNNNPTSRQQRVTAKKVRKRERADWRSQHSTSSPGGSSLWLADVETDQEENQRNDGTLESRLTTASMGQQKPPLKSALKSSASRLALDSQPHVVVPVAQAASSSDTTYEYLPLDHPQPTSSFVRAGTTTFRPSPLPLPQPQSSSAGVYDAVYDTYLAPTRMRKPPAAADAVAPAPPKTTTISEMNPRTTTIDDVAVLPIQQTTTTKTTTQKTSTTLTTTRFEESRGRGEGSCAPAAATAATVATAAASATEKPRPPPKPAQRQLLPIKPLGVKDVGQRIVQTRDDDGASSTYAPPRIDLNVFDASGKSGSQRSLASIALRPETKTATTAAAGATRVNDIFERPDSVDWETAGTWRLPQQQPTLQPQPQQMRVELLKRGRVHDEDERSIGSTANFYNATMPVGNLQNRSTASIASSNSSAVASAQRRGSGNQAQQAPAIFLHPIVDDKSGETTV